MRSSQAATQKNETSSKTKIIKYVRVTLKDCQKTADVRKFRVNAALLHFEVNPIAPVYCRGLQSEQSHCDVSEAAAAPGGLTLRKTFRWPNIQFPKFFFFLRGEAPGRGRGGGWSWSASLATAVPWGST